MNIILLSGGSGKRLWPLSNDIRSKQFIKLFKNENNEYESMVQRVYGQISRNINAPVTIATSKSQVSAIKNQLGEKVSVCIEPCRRDTFPAIALASAYLKYELGVSEDECVCVCPVDPYVDDSYYKTVGSLEKYVINGSANLVLMGIEPTYPSEKYGYIIPNDSKEISKVLEFKEKPSKTVAEEYIAKNALWNAGVFGFKLGYLLEKAHNIIEFTDYRDLYQKYDKLEKISFDYAVVEKEKNIQVVKYNGDWRDVGIWTMMTEVMPEQTKGNVKLDEFSTNTNVINELDIPIIGMGLKNMVVVASSDGILVSTKDRCDNIKPYAESLGEAVKIAEKSWGTYQVIDIQPTSLTVKISLKEGHFMSYHHHEFRDEVWNFVSGKGVIIVDGIKREVSAGDVVRISAGCNHTVKAITDISIIEVQIGENISVSDKIKQEIDF